jgi:DNA-binding winged helix-turn-helix (wHTH) protein/TolB-like protein/Flp pilus assembly protein TadD
MIGSSRQSYQFGEFRLDPEKRRLWRGSELVQLTPKAIETLLVLVRRRGELVERDALISAVWRDVAVEDGNLSVTISMLRKALGTDGDGRRFIETVPRLGYKFVADVREAFEDPALIVEKRTLARLTIEEEPGEQLESKTRTSGRRRLMAIAVIVVLISACGLVYFARSLSTRTEAGASRHVKSIAILPFKTIGYDSERSHQGLGLADILITRLSNLQDLNVRPTSAVMQFENHEADSASVGRTLQVDAVLEGTLYLTSDKVRVTARLVRVSDQSSLWAGEFEEPMDDEIRLQDEIARVVADGLAVNLSGAERRFLTKRYTESADAYQLYLKGRYHWNKRNNEGLWEAQRLFRNAIEKDPGFALAYAGLADSLIFSYSTGDTSAAFDRALELDPTLAEAHATKGFFEAIHNWRWQAAEAEFKRAIELNPGYATSHHWYATLLGIEGRNEEAKAEMRRALEIDPLSYNFLADLGQILYFNHEYDLAKGYCQKALEVYPGFGYAHTYLSEIYLLTHEDDAAIQETVMGMADLGVAGTESASGRGSRERSFESIADSAKRAGLKDFLESVVSAHPTEANMYYGRARAYVLLGDKEKALDNLEKGFELRAFMMPWVKANPIFDSLRMEPRYQDLLRRMGLAS